MTTDEWYDTIHDKIDNANSLIAEYDCLQTKHASDCAAFKQFSTLQAVRKVASEILEKSTVLDFDLDITMEVFIRFYSENISSLLTQSFSNVYLNALQEDEFDYGIDFGRLLEKQRHSRKISLIH